MTSRTPRPGASPRHGTGRGAAPSAPVTVALRARPGPPPLVRPVPGRVPRRSPRPSPELHRTASPNAVGLRWRNVGGGVDGTRRGTERWSRGGRPVLRGPRDADARRRLRRARTDADRGTATPAPARDALLRAFRAHRLRAVPGIRRGARRGPLPELLRDGLERFRAAPRRGRGAGLRHRRPDDHVRAHRGRLVDRGAAAPGAPPRRRRGAVPGRLRRCPHGCAAGCDGVPVPAVGRRRGPARGAPAGGVPLRRDRRRRPRHGRVGAARPADPGERRLLRAAPGDLRPHPRGRVPRGGRVRRPGAGREAAGAPPPRLPAARRHGRGAHGAGGRPPRRDAALDAPGAAVPGPAGGRHRPPQGGVRPGEADVPRAGRDAPRPRGPVPDGGAAGRSGGLSRPRRP